MRALVDIRSDMGQRVNFCCQVLADALVPAIEMALWLRFKFKQEEWVSVMNYDSYYEPPEALTREAYAFCGNCGGDTLHEFVKWQPYGEGTAQCLTCHDIWDVEWDQ